MEGDIVIVFDAVLVQPPIVTEYVISDVPAETPVTNPVASTVATDGVALVQVPPVVVPVQVAVEPMHNGVVPVIVWATGAVIVTDLLAVFTQPPMVTE